MQEIIQAVSDPLAAAAMDRNMAEEMTLWGYVQPDSALHREQELLWVASGKAFFNGVLLTNLRSAESAYSKAIIQKMIRYFESQQRSFSWSVGPSTYPANLTESLMELHFRKVAKSIGQAVNLHELPGEVSLPPSLTIREITALEDMAIKRTIERDGFDASEEGAQDYYNGHIGVGFGPGKPWHHYLGYWDETPVAMCSLLLYAGVAGIYGVTTLPHMRRRGIGTAMTRYVLQAARLAGYRVAVLTSTEMSYAIYQRIGFRDHCRVTHYQWSPQGENI